MFRQLGLVVWLFASGALVGCGGSDLSLARSEGVVIYKDEPVAGATVTFFQEGAPLATGVTDSSGKFVMSTGGRPGAPIGTTKVSVTKFTSPAGAAGPKMTEKDLEAIATKEAERLATQGPSAPAPPAEYTPKSEIPEKYSTPETSQLTAVVDPNPANNSFEFRLVD